MGAKHPLAPDDPRPKPKPVEVSRMARPVDGRRRAMVRLTAAAVAGAAIVVIGVWLLATLAIDRPPAGAAPGEHGHPVRWDRTRDVLVEGLFFLDGDRPSVVAHSMRGAPDVYRVGGRRAGELRRALATAPAAGDAARIAYLRLIYPRVAEALRMQHGIEKAEDVGRVELALPSALFVRIEARLAPVEGGCALRQAWLDRIIEVRGLKE